MKGDILIEKTEVFVKKQLEGEGTGHDWFHIKRVHDNAVKIAEKEGGDLLKVRLAALLHDIADHKFHHGDLNKGPEIARTWLLKIGASESLAEEIAKIVYQISYKGANVPSKMDSLEGKIVQDADRLDAIGAIGIARAFAYGGAQKRELYNPEIAPEMHDSFEAYRIDKGHTINHFYEKLLLLKDRMNTETAKQMASGRHHFMEKFLERFYDEWGMLQKVGEN